MDPVDDSTYKNIWMATAKVSEMEIWYLEELVTIWMTILAPHGIPELFHLQELTIFLSIVCS